MGGAALSVGVEGAARRRVGLFGGSFDPIHHGHVAPVQAAREALGLERVVVLPTARPPHKPQRRLASPLARFAMVELALLAEPGLYVSDHELTLGRPAYTVETVEWFRAELPDADLHLLVGADSFVELPTWRRWRELTELARLVVLARPGWELARVLPELPAELSRLVEAGRIDFVTHRLVDLSATEVREALARGEDPPPGSVPGLVLDYIRKYSLYR
ncbi:MAG TPA: nicotinate-nucleotide adenylyltransferase [Thermoanaerobaculia bacterium]|nr:nicotinate-nucleotide adenylyltransferase [Thermoanaerobaculia bacterium]